MKNLVIKTLVMMVLSLAFSCNQNDNAEEPEFLPPGEILTGTWLMTDYGYSPGDRYITEPIAPVPAQTITFKENGEMSSNAEGFSQYKYYRVMAEPLVPGADRNIVALFTTDPGSQPLDINNLSPSYTIFFTETHLKLSYRWCIEGCHVGLKRMAVAEENP